MTYLNEGFDSGETHFPMLNLEVTPEKGKTLIWPAEWTHAHRGEILNKGYKYIITGWMHFPFSFKFDLFIGLAVESFPPALLTSQPEP